MTIEISKTTGRDVSNGSKPNRDGITETFSWCETCWLADPEKKTSNSGGECCTLKIKRPFGKSCDRWIMKKEAKEEKRC